MRGFLAAVLTAATTAAVWAQAPEYFPLKAGTRKHFQAVITQNTNAGGQAMNVTLYFLDTEEVVGQSKVYDKPAILVRTIRRDSVPGRPVEGAKPGSYIESYYQTRPQGIFLLATLNLPADTARHKPDSTRYEPSLQLLKLPVDSGSSWSMGTMKMQGGILINQITAQMLGKEDLQVAAGTFKNCLKVKRSSSNASGSLQGAAGFSMNVTSGDYTSTSWYSPGVGLVKQEVATRFVLTSPKLPPGMTAELSFQQNLVLTKMETAPKEKKEDKKK